MNKRWVLWVMASGIWLYGQSQQQPVQKNGSYLLTTSWGQHGAYAGYTPGKQVLGCWSTALAQVLFYHRLQPTGTVNYQCSNGTAVHNNLGSKRYNFNNMALVIDSATPAPAASLTAAYSYDVATAIGKDFGMPRYLQLVNPVPRLQEYFKCDAEFYAGFGGPVPYTTSELLNLAEKEQISHFVDNTMARQLVTREIDARRPVYFHYGNFGNYGHSVVVDGYLAENGIFWVHINYGDGGAKNGWYNLEQPIDVADDTLLRAFVTVQPKAGKLKQLFNKYINPFAVN